MSSASIPGFRFHFRVRHPQSTDSRTLVEPRPTPARVTRTPRCRGPRVPCPCLGSRLRSRVRRSGFHSRDGTEGAQGCGLGSSTPVRPTTPPAVSGETDWLVRPRSCPRHHHGGLRNDSLRWPAITSCCLCCQTQTRKSSGQDHNGDLGRRCGRARGRAVPVRHQQISDAYGPSRNSNWLAHRESAEKFNRVMVSP